MCLLVGLTGLLNAVFCAPNEKPLARAMVLCL